MGEIAVSKGGYGFPLNKQGNKSGDYPFFKVSDMNSPGNERFMQTSNNWIDADTLKELRAKTFPASAIVFPKIGAALLTNKKRLLVQESVVDNNVMAVVVINQKECLPEFLYQWFLTLDLGRVASSGTVPSLTSGQIQKVYVPLPPLTEQRRIAHVLAAVQTPIEQQARLIALMRELKSALMGKLFTEGLRREKQKETDIGLVPESWHVLSLDELLTRTQYGLSVRGEDTGSCGILRMTNQVEGKIATDKMQYVNIGRKDFEKYRLEHGDILFNRTNSLELVGRTAIHDIEGEYVFASYLIRLNTDEKKLNPFFLNQFLNWDESQRRLKSIALRAIGQSNISATRLRTFQIPVPPLEEQTEIITNIETVIGKIELHRRRKEILEELFRTLLQQLMTGQTRVNKLDFGAFEAGTITEE